MDKPKIILDCDPGHDDALAIVVAARHTDLLGITTVSGNAPIESTTYNTLVMKDLLGLDVPVHKGAIRPLVAPRNMRLTCTAKVDLMEPIFLLQQARSIVRTLLSTSSILAARPRVCG